MALIYTVPLRGCNNTCWLRLKRATVSYVVGVRIDFSKRVAG